jgi:ABC-2 type transport system permease protein
MLAELRAVGWRALAYFLVLEGMLVAAILLWPNFEENVGALRKMVPLQMLKDIGESIEERGIAAYVNAQQFFKACNTLGSAVAVFFAMSAVAGEAHRGTLEIWLARPISRARMLNERFAAGALALVVPILATTATIPLLLESVGEELELGPLLLCAVHQSLFLLVLYAATFLYSCCSSRPALIAFVMLVFAIVEFSLYMVQHATHWSVYRLSDLAVYDRIYDMGRLDAKLVVPLTVLTLVLFALAHRAFARRVP